MTRNSETLRSLVLLSLLVLVILLTLSLWVVDISTMQRPFAAFLAAELMAFALMGYVYLKPSLEAVGRAWFLSGCAFLGLLVLIAMM